VELRRTPGDRRRYVLDGVGSLRVSGLIARKATADAAGASWEFRRRGRAAQATDRLGTVVGAYAPIALGRGGRLRWGERELELKSVGKLWQEHYALLDGRSELARFRGRSWGRAPVRISLADDAALEPELLLFVAFVVRGLAEYAAQ
jgi:hypothetical protein